MLSISLVKSAPLTGLQHSPYARFYKHAGPTERVMISFATSSKGRGYAKPICPIAVHSARDRFNRKAYLNPG